MKTFNRCVLGYGFFVLNSMTVLAAEVYDRKIPVTSGMIKLVADGSLGNTALLVDEQPCNALKYSLEKEAKLVPSEPCPHPTTNWKVPSGSRVNRALVDLGDVYNVEDIVIFDSNNIGTFRAYTASSSTAVQPGTMLGEIALDSYLRWKPVSTFSMIDLALQLKHRLPYKTRYLMLENTNGYAGIGEIMIYGSKVATMDYSHFSSVGITDARKEELNNAVLNSSTQPQAAHPRLHGPNSKWYSNVKYFDSVNPNCEWKGQDAWGFVKNMKAVWDRFTLGGDKCAGKLPATLAAHPDAKFYLEPVAGVAWNNDRGLRLLHLFRRSYACYASGSNDCVYPKADIDYLANAFLAYEFKRQRAEKKNASGYYPSWHRGWPSASFIDLGSLNAFKFWCLVLDIFWNHSALLATDKAYIAAELENEIDSYLELYHMPEGAPNAGSLGRWALWGGNNWTTVLNAAAMYWAITFWHEKPAKAKEVMAAALETSWLHRNYFFLDGAYVEGPSYAPMTVDAMLESNELLKGSFNQPYHALRWKTLSQKTTKWYLDNVSSDGLLLDFGDAWDRTGYSDYHYIYLLAWEEMLGLKPYGSTSFNPCDIKAFFANNYFAQSFYDPWSVSSILARDWASIVAQCSATAQAGTRVSHYPDFQLGTLRTFLPGATQTAASAGDNLKLTQADQTFLGMTAVANYHPHREIDFGGLIWTAFGGKLLYDFGYGELSGNYSYYDVSGNKGRFVKESDADRIEFYIRQIDLPITLANLKIGITVHFLSKELPLSSYLASVGTTWAKVSIPLKDFGIDPVRWTSIRGQPGEPWATPGLEAIYFRNYGSINKGHMGIDEMKIVSGVSSTKNVLWYGDLHPQSMADGARAEHSSFYLVAEEIAGGAASTAKWAKIFVGSAGNNFRLSYSNNPNEFVVANKMDYLPIGANTLILPKATDNGKVGTHRSQFKGQAGTLEKLVINGRPVLFADGSKVYGSELTNGNLDYFHRYTVGLEGGNYLVIDSFKTKTGKQDKVQELWYTNQSEVAPVDCSKPSYDVNMTRPTSNTLILEPRCNQIKRGGASESAGRIIAASMVGANFYLGVPDFMKADGLFKRFIVGSSVKLMNRLRGWEIRRVARYQPSVDVTEDVRVFLLQSATSVAALPSNSSISKVSCGTDKACFKVMNGGKQHNVEVLKINGKYTLQRVL